MGGERGVERATEAFDGERYDAYKPWLMETVVMIEGRKELRSG